MYQRGLWQRYCLFSGCTLKCCFCQNYKISSEGFGREFSPGRLTEIFLKLQEKNAHNINLVTATQFLPSIIEALAMVKGKLLIPVIYNCGGYETVDAVKALAQMMFQTGGLVFEDYKGVPLLKKGVIIRHMVLPGHKEDSIRLMHFLHDSLPEGTYLLSLLSQYTPFYKSGEYPEINRKITTYEYEKVLDTTIGLGLTKGYMQRKSSAKEKYTPSFNLEGIGIDI